MARSGTLFRHKGLCSLVLLFELAGWSGLARRCRGGEAEATGPAPRAAGALARPTWLQMPAVMAELAARLAPVDEETVDGEPEVTKAEEYIGPFLVVHATPEALAEYKRHKATVKRPGPRLPGWRESEFLRRIDLERFLEPGLGATWRSRAYCAADVAGQQSDMGWTEHEIAAHAQGPWALFAGAKARWMRFTSRPLLPDTGGRFPRNLWDFQVEGQAPCPLPPGIYNVTIGSASDRPFASGDEMTADITWLVGGPMDWGNVFIFFLNYQNNRDFLNPGLVPGCAWRYKRGDWLTFVLGFPFSSAAWRPVRGLEVGASYRFPRTVYAQVAYVPCEGVRLFGGFNWTSRRWYRHDRRRTRDRLWYLEKRLEVGLEWQITEHVALEVACGYAFDRFWFEGERYEDRGQNRIDVADGPFATVNLRVRF